MSDNIQAIQLTLNEQIEILTQEIENLDERLAIQKVEFEEEKEALMGKLMRIKDIVSGNYETLDPLAKKEIEKLLNNI